MIQVSNKEENISLFNHNKPVLSISERVCFYNVATFLLKKSLNFLVVSILSMILKTVFLSYSSSCWISCICSTVFLSSMVISWGISPSKFTSWSMVMWKCLAILPRRAGYVHHKKENVIACGWDMLSQPLVLLGFAIRYF